jgi:hypothetical protein
MVYTYEAGTVVARLLRDGQTLNIYIASISGW